MGMQVGPIGLEGVVERSVGRQFEKDGVCLLQEVADAGQFEPDGFGAVAGIGCRGYEALGILFGNVGDDVVEGMGGDGFFGDGLGHDELSLVVSGILPAIWLQIACRGFSGAKMMMESSLMRKCL